MSMFPLNGATRAGSPPSAATRSLASAPLYSTFARVVSKWLLLTTTWPLSTSTEKRIFSAALPWWVGITSLNPVRSRTTSSNRKKEGLPA
ncbi:MAG: hypothetical protein MAG471_00849 [Acidimicrobiaceae bacterium]|nr:hypothetical protein [Acidimicrobiaceae bacterium]